MSSTQESAVSNAVNALHKAMVAADKPALEKMLMAELSYNHSSGRHENKAECIATFVGGKSGFSAVDIEGQTVSIVGSVALARYTFNGTRRKEGDKVKLYTLTVWMQSQGQWKLLARHAAKL